MDDVVQALLIIRRHMAIRKLITEKCWMVGDTGAF